MPSEDHYRKLERMYLGAPINEYFRPSITVGDGTARFDVDLFRPISGGEMVAVGRVAHATRRLIVADAALEDERGRSIGRGSGTFMRSDVRLAPELGYR